MLRKYHKLGLGDGSEARPVTKKPATPKAARAQLRESATDRARRLPMSHPFYDPGSCGFGPDHIVEDAGRLSLAEQFNGRPPVLCRLTVDCTSGDCQSESACRSWS
jgi:hypothetical protein